MCACEVRRTKFDSLLLFSKSEKRFKQKKLSMFQGSICVHKCAFFENEPSFLATMPRREGKSQIEFWKSLNGFKAAFVFIHIGYRRRNMGLQHISFFKTDYNHILIKLLYLFGKIFLYMAVSNRDICFTKEVLLLWEHGYFSLNFELHGLTYPPPPKKIYA